jgi:hypothetical protein
MIAARQLEKVVMKDCHHCNGQLSVPDSFCRWCGIHQGDEEETLIPVNNTGWRDQKTKPVQMSEDISRTLSSLPLNALAETAVAKTGSLRLSRLGVLAVAVLIAIPMWLLIILLSPLDAYATAKAASSRMNAE